MLFLCVHMLHNVAAASLKNRKTSSKKYFWIESKSEWPRSLQGVSGPSIHWEPTRHRRTNRRILDWEITVSQTLAIMGDSNLAPLYTRRCANQYFSERHIYHKSVLELKKLQSFHRDCSFISEVKQLEAAATSSGNLPSSFSQFTTFCPPNQLFEWSR